MDDRLLPGHRFERRQRRLEPRFRCAEGLHVRGKLDSNCWYAANASYSWGNGGNFIITLDKAYDINGFRWHIYYEDSNPECTDFQYSEDGTNWYSLTNEISFVPKLSADNWKIFQFKKTVKARYLRVYVGRVTDFTSMNEAEIFAPAN